MTKLRDLTQQRFGRILVLERDTTKYLGLKKTVRWWCKCDCGTIFSVISCDIVRGHTNSCGCYHREAAKKSLTEIKSRNSNFHLSKTRTYRIWCAMKQRCFNPKFKFYHYYGGRGISMCDQWKDYTVFLNEMGEAPPDGTLDRIDCDGNYNKENCRWVTMAVQNNNRRSCKYVVYNNKKFNLKQFSKEYNLSYYYVCGLYKNGLSADKIIKILSQ